MITQYCDLFAQSKSDVGHINHQHHKIDLSNEMPIFLKPYRTSPREQKIIDETTIFTSPYSFPVTLAEKKGEGKTRMCIDYRKLNDVTVTDKQPIPIIDDIIDKLYEKKYFTKFDIANGYWHVLIAPEDLPKTAFSTHNQHLEWLVMPFGLKNAPSDIPKSN
ncbi:hypothetical protein DERF_005021 [Dermatophagoides farinae]|uniref:Reverse transcriptase domain-containing protein n=1 Tax=Dermatophagoides farinae TaxID=6954 RepID=A0A922I8I7_DERFA|nr:hypothetical protein DERF_005021 [Dermatophagoides farinae]